MVMVYWLWPKMNAHFCNAFLSTAFPFMSFTAFSIIFVDDFYFYFFPMLVCVFSSVKCVTVCCMKWFLLLSVAHLLSFFRLFCQSLLVSVCNFFFVCIHSAVTLPQHTIRFSVHVSNANDARWHPATATNDHT